MAGTDFEEIVVQRDGDRDIRFVGKLLASFESSPSDSSVYYSGRANFWTELELYQTKGGKFVCQRIECSSWGNYRNEYHAAVCENESQVLSFFGYSVIAKELYDNAGISTAVEVE